MSALCEQVRNIMSILSFGYRSLTKVTDNSKKSKKKFEKFERKNLVKICKRGYYDPLLTDLDRFQGQIDEADPHK